MYINERFYFAHNCMRKTRYIFYPVTCLLPKQEQIRKYMRSVTLSSARLHNEEAYRSGCNGLNSKSCDNAVKLNNSYMERYRSGHNGADSKCCSVCGQKSASNPHGYWILCLATQRVERIFFPIFFPTSRQ